MRFFSGALLVLLAVWLAGCSPQPGGARYPEDARGALWPFWPTQMRFHPLTRLVKEAGAGVWVIEARVEFRDAEGAMSKAIGELVIQLEDGASP
ncbi:MAG: hypothetical protein L0Y44_12760, partial [Phycisphaerales bacterium]|nr:hypothetical protein [Phycisphaerales bacterium]